MSHCAVRDLSRYVDAELSDEERRVMNVHLRTCSACALELEKFRRVDRALAAWGTLVRPVPRETEARILRSVEERKPHTSRILNRFAPAALGSVLAAVVLAAGINVNLAPQSSSTAAAGPLVAATRYHSYRLHLIRSRSAILGVQVETQTATIAPRRLAVLNVE